MSQQMYFVMVYLNRAPIIWFSIQQNTVESSSFGSEFVAMRIALEIIEGMMGIPIDGPTNVFCDNQLVFRNTTAPESTLKKKHTAINYHWVQEAVAAETIWIAKEPTATNLSDILTKCLPGPCWCELADRILW
jgi:hypothetical protein